MPESAVAEPPKLTKPLEPIRVRAKFFFEGDRKFFIKGVTYGPFAPDAAGEFFGTPEKARTDFKLMFEIGVNLLRVYYVPPRWFLDLCREFGLRVLISIPWAEHVEFLNQGKIRREIEKAVRVGGPGKCRTRSDLRLPRRQRDPEPDGALARRKTRHVFRRKAD